MAAHKELIEAVNACTPPTGACAFWWLGQHGFCFKLGRITLYIDLYLSGGSARLLPPPLQPEEVTNADFFLGTHDHADHVDRQSWARLAAASPQARFVAPDMVRDRLLTELQIPPERLKGANAGQTLELSGLTVTGIAAAHEFLDRDPATGRHPYLGYVIEGNGLTVYHSGDTCVYEGLLAALKPHRPDIVLLPINGRDAVRYASGCIGNMTYQEAADLAGALEPRLTVPAHYGMFAGNTIDPQPFADYMRVKYPALAVRLCEPGQRVDFSR